MLGARKQRNGLLYQSTPAAANKAVKTNFEEKQGFNKAVTLSTQE